MILTRKVALGVAGLVVAGVVGTAGVAAATSDDSTPAPTASAAPGSTAAPSGTADRKHRIRRAALARGMHGEWVVKGKDGKPVTLVSIRGEVTAVSPTSVTVKAEDGFTETFTVNSDTKVRGGVDKISDVKVGVKGAAIGVRTGNTSTARAVLVRK